MNHSVQCLNPNCSQVNPPQHNFCQYCGESLILRSRYQTRKFLAQGGFGRAFLACDRDTLDTPCVIKQFLPNLGNGSNELAWKKSKELFQREAQQLKELGKHPNIPNLLAFFEEQGRLYIVQEYIHGPNLLALMAQKGPFPERQVLFFLVQLLRILDYIHGQGTIHRDIKPANIIYEPGKKQYVLIDFGISKQVGSHLTQMGTSAGTAIYAPPEQLKGYVDFSSDLYGLAATAVRLLTNAFPQEVNGSLEDPVYDILNCEWVFGPWCQDHQVPLNPALEEILLKMLSLKPSDRFPSAKAVLERLQQEKTKAQQGPRVKNRTNQPLPHPSAIAIVSPASPRPQSNGGQAPPANPTTSENSFLENIFGPGQPLEMLKISPGRFWMGSAPSDRDPPPRESPGHWVTIHQEFHMGKFPISQGQWQALMGNNPANFPISDRHPVENVSWNQCQVFLEKLREQTGKPYRLPSEAEWEYACRGGNSGQMPYFFGAATEDLAQYAWYGGDWWRGSTSPLGEKQANGFGLYDVYGNVWEWCEDDYEAHYQQPRTQEPFKRSSGKTSDRVMRGGAWISPPSECRSAARRQGSCLWGSNAVGLRVVCCLNH